MPKTSPCFSSFATPPRAASRSNCPKEKKRLSDYSARTVHEDPEQWSDANTLVISTSGTYTKGDHGDGFDKLVSIRVDDQGKARIVTVKARVIE